MAKRSKEEVLKAQELVDDFVCCALNSRSYSPVVSTIMEDWNKDVEESEAMTNDRLITALEVMKEELNIVPRKVKWVLGEGFYCPWCDNDSRLGEFCSECGKPIDWEDDPVEEKEDE